MFWLRLGPLPTTKCPLRFPCGATATREARPPLSNGGKDRPLSGNGNPVAFAEDPPAAHPAAAAPSGPLPRLVQRLWQEPTRTWLAVVAAAGLLVLRKPWALTTPQLWAEDGPVHLFQNEQYGAGAFFAPYRGYLHLLPRFIAWFASQVADVLYWPAIYNTASFLVAVALFARLASRRLDLPGKPWLVLSFVLAAHTGEVWFNITNLHWLTSFFLLLQTLIARPATPAQRFGDLALLAVIGLTGPFIVVFLPLFAWRWWRERHRDTLAVFLTAAACAAVQLYFIATSGPAAGPQGKPLNLELLLAVAGSRLVVWPFLGEEFASNLPWPVLGALGIAFIVAVVTWALRPDSRRLLRLQIVVAFVSIGSVCLWRIRPDTWAYPDLVNGDSYFYIARILLLWLVIWEFDARPRAVAWVARGACVFGLLVEIRHYRLPAPPDYRWADYCDALRHGEPAKIPTLPEGFIFDYGGRPGGAPRRAPLIPLAPPPEPGRLVNLSVLTRLAADEPSFTIGATLGGAGASGAKPLLVRAAGPSLAPIGVTDGLPDPALAIVQGDSQVAANDNWGSGGAEALNAAFKRVGAFSFMSGVSRDAALAFSPAIRAPTSYTIEVRGNGAAGTVLAEVYDATPPQEYKSRTPRLTNFSVLKRLPADEVLTTGFVIGGATAQRVLVRAIGPTLAPTFGLRSALADPKIELFDHERKLIAHNNDWAGEPKLAAMFTHVGAFTLPDDSKDAALVVMLKPGTYSAQITGPAAATGMVLVEIYEVP